MNTDPNMFNQLLNKINYPIGKDQFIQFARKQGFNEQIVDMLDKFLPNKNFNTAQDLQGFISSMGSNMGNLGNIGKMGKTGGMGSGQQL